MVAESVHERVDPDFVVAAARELVRTPSVNPGLAAPGEAAGEGGVAEVVVRLLEGMGVETHRLEETPGRPSVVGVLEGGGGPSLMLNAHYDTVGVAAMDEPFSGRVEGGRLYGRGSYDMKGALAACLGALKAFVDAGVEPPGDLLVSAVADEETESLGVREVLRSWRPDAVVVTEPTALRPCVAHKGFVWADVVAGGRAAHGSRPDLGEDANLKMAAALAPLARLRDEVAGRDPHPLLGPGSLHVGRIDGGEGASTYAARCVAQIERRTLPGESGEAVMEEIRDALGPGVELHHRLTREAFEADPDGPVVAAVDRALEAVTGSRPPRVGEGPWMDSAFFAAAGADTVVLGPDGAGAHAAEEWVDVESMVTLARVLARTAWELGRG